MRLETRREVIGKLAKALGLVAGCQALGPLLRAQVDPQEVVFETPINLITTPTNSPPIRNIGQAMHLIQVAFNFTGAIAPVSGFDVCLEWSRDGVDWRPAGPSVTSAPELNYGDASNDVLAYAAYYGAFRAIRVAANYTGADPKMDVRYTGTVIPVDPFVTLTGDRWVF